MSGKLLWTGLTLISAAPLLGGIPAVVIIGEVVMIFGLVLMWLDK